MLTDILREEGRGKILEGGRGGEGPRGGKDREREEGGRAV